MRLCLTHWPGEIVCLIHVPGLVETEAGVPVLAVVRVEEPWRVADVRLEYGVSTLR